MLRAKGISSTVVKNFKRTRQRIENRQAGLKIVKPYPCVRLTIKDLRSEFHISKSFARLQQLAKTNYQICHLVLMSLRNKLPQIDARFQNSVKLAMFMKLSFKDDGGTDIEGSSLQTARVAEAKLHESFSLVPGGNVDGTVQVKAVIS
jgi:hypothetical protein